MAPETVGHASLSDVYALVDRMRTETTDKIDALGEKLESYATATEKRLTTMEVRQDSHDKQFVMVVHQLDQHGKEIGTLKDLRTGDAAVASANAQRWTSREKILASVTATVAAGAGLAIAIHALG